MRLYLVENSLYHLCPGPVRYHEYHCFYKRREDYYVCSDIKCGIKFPAIFAMGSDLNRHKFMSVNYFNKTYGNAPYIDL